MAAAAAFAAAAAAALAVKCAGGAFHEGLPAVNAAAARADAFSAFARAFFSVFVTWDGVIAFPAFVTKVSAETAPAGGASGGVAARSGCG